MEKMAKDSGITFEGVKLSELFVRRDEGVGRRADGGARVLAQGSQPPGRVLAPVQPLSRHRDELHRRERRLGA